MTLARPALKVLGEELVEVGSLREAAAMKLAVNNLVLSLNQGLSESLILAERAGIRSEFAYQVFSSPGAAPILRYRRQLFERPRSTAPDCRLELAIKDLDLILDLAHELGLRLPQAEASQHVPREAGAAGLSQDDVSAVSVHLRRQQTRQW